MPKRTDIESILLIGSGPIVIGQACEFDYSGTQAIKALKEEGYRVILVNSNPATIMTDPELADRTYIEPITADVVEAIIRAERPDAVLPTMGGQTALNTALELGERGVFERYGVELIGASLEAIRTAEDRALFRRAMDEIGLESAPSGLARSLEEARQQAAAIGYPLVLRPSRTLGGSGGGVVLDERELDAKVSHALGLSPNHEVLIEESLIGWKEIELEVMRDLKDNVVVVCTIENLDPMGVHTGDSITVAPIQTLTDKEYQLLRDAAIRVMRRIGVDTGGSNVQFAVNPTTGRVIIIEMNPRVSRSSALASKATGFPIARIAAKLAVGYTLDEIPNDITRETPACFEPSIDYVVVKIPRFNFEKFRPADTALGTQMKSVGEVMSFGRSFREALQKALSSMETGACGFDRAVLARSLDEDALAAACRRPSPDRVWLLGEALRRGHRVEALARDTGVDAWFLAQMREIIAAEEAIRGRPLPALGTVELHDLKRDGFSDRRLAELLSCGGEEAVRARRDVDGIRPVYKKVDTCAAEFTAHTPYLYSSYDREDEAPPSMRRKVIILGSGPNRIGQGIEFDYCCVHAVMALREDGYETIMINCNPETVSTDYDISDRLYFEPLTFEHVMNVVRREREGLCGVIVQLGGQTPLNLSAQLRRHGVPIAGTSVESIDAAEDRERFSRLVGELGLRQPESATVRSAAEARAAAARLGYPLMLRPSFVLGGRAMRVAHDAEDLERYVHDTVHVSDTRPVLIDRFLESAIEVDVDAVSDGIQVVVAGVMEHVERAGVHSGDSSCCIPPQTLGPITVRELKRQAVILARALQVVGLINVQFAVTRDGTVYILEANPRASRTVPFVSKATGVPWAKVAARLMLGARIAELGVREPADAHFVSVKSSVFPFGKFPGVDPVLGPEMKSTGEVMGIDRSMGAAFAKAQRAAGVALPTAGCVLLSVVESDVTELLPVAAGLRELGFSLVATAETSAWLSRHGIAAAPVGEGAQQAVALLRRGGVALVIDTHHGPGSRGESAAIRIAAGELRLPSYTTLAAAAAAVEAIGAMQRGEHRGVTALQDHHRALASPETDSPSLEAASPRRIAAGRGGGRVRASRARGG